MTSAPLESPRRALVLGGGGVAGIAWHLGMLAELLEQGIPVDGADLVIGTSAGSVAGSILRFGQVPATYRVQISEEVPDLPAGDPSVAPADMSTFRERVVAAISGATSEQDARARLGRAAVDAAQGAESVLLPTMAQQFPPAVGWPEAPLGVTVVDAHTGDFRVIDASDGVELFRAVAASCSVPLVFPPVEIDGATYVDGGARSATNADVARDYDRVLVLACGPEDPASPLGPQLDRAVSTLSESADVLVLSADDASLQAFGANSLAGTTRIPSALAGRAQAAARAEEVRAFWS